MVKKGKKHTHTHSKKNKNKLIKYISHLNNSTLEGVHEYIIKKKRTPETAVRRDLNKNAQ